jgi:hypothetical protein
MLGFILQPNLPQKILPSTVQAHVGFYPQTTILIVRGYCKSKRSATANEIGNLQSSTHKGTGSNINNIYKLISQMSKIQIHR